MRLTAKIKLEYDTEVGGSLFSTMALSNAACTWLSEQVFDSRIFGKFRMQKEYYQQLREMFPDLSAQAVIHVIRKVADSYKLDKKTLRTYDPLGAITYDLRILSWKKDTVSIWTADGRKTIPFVCGDHQRKQLMTQKGETDLILQDGQFYLATCCEVYEPEMQWGNYQQPLGVDLGIAKIATDSDGNVYSGSKVKNIRFRHRRLRQQLQKAGTKSARRHLRKLSGKEARFARDTNHVISKAIVRTAKGICRGIALEDLSGIRDRITVRKSQRAGLHSWSFYQIRQFIVYKAQLAGVAVVFICARNTSRQCSKCEYTDKANRKSQDKFACLSCGHTENADLNAARNISRRAYVITPIACQSNHNTELALQAQTF